MIWRGQLWQYPAKTQPVHEVTLPTLDWLVQQPDPVRRPAELVSEQFAFTRLVELSEIPIGWLPQYPDFVRGPPELVHEQLAFLRFVELSEITIDWLLQQPDPVLLPERLVPGETTLVEEFVAPPAVPDIGWLVQQPDPVRQAPELVHEQFSFLRLVELSEIPIGWLVQHPDPVRPPLRLIPGEQYFTRLVELSEITIDWLVQHPVAPPPLPLPQQPDPLTFQPEPIIPAFDWFVQGSDVIRRVPPVLQGASVLVEFGVPVPPTVPDIDFIVQHPVPPLPLPLPQQPDSFAFGPVPIIPAFDWFVQETDVIRRAPPVLQGASVLVEFSVPVVIDVDWLVQHPDPLPKPPPTQTQPELAFEHEDLIPAPDWLVQHPEPVRPPERLVPEAFAFEFEHELLVPSIDWLQQHPDPIQELRRPPTEPAAPELAELPPEIVLLDKWWQQLPDPIQPEERRQDWYVRGELVEIPIDTWLQPPSQPVLPLPPRQDYYARDLTIPEVLLDEWWQPASQPVRLPIQLVRFHGELFLIEFAVPPGVGIPYVFRECQALWEIIHPSSWESAVASSGYIPLPEYIPPPSGYIEPIEPTPVPSGYIAEEDGAALWDMVR